MPKIFLTGASGFIGGDFLAAVTKAHPEYSIRALVRSEWMVSKIQETFNTVQPVHGNLNDAQLLRREASKADITINLAAAKHLEGLKSMHEGAAERAKAHFIQISGATLVSQDEIFSKTFGKPSDMIYDDMEGAQDFRNIIKKYPNHEVENYIMNASKQDSQVKNAVVVAPLIYGQGRGPGNQTSVQVPELCRIAIERRRAAQIGEGRNIWSNIHIADVSSLLLYLVEKAAVGDDDEKLWGENGLFFAESNAGITFESLVRRIANSAYEKGLLQNSGVDHLSADDMDELIPHGAPILGTNARVSASRARQVLGWQPKYISFDSEMSRVVIAQSSKV